MFPPEAVPPDAFEVTVEHEDLARGYSPRHAPGPEAREQAVRVHGDGPGRNGDVAGLLDPFEARAGRSVVRLPFQDFAEDPLRLVGVPLAEVDLAERGGRLG